MRKVDLRGAGLAALVGLMVVTIVVAADAGWLQGWVPWLYATPGLDKVCHLIIMGGLAFVFCRAVPDTALMASGLLVVVTAEEFSQLFLRHRSFDWADLACDWIGIGLAVWIIHKLFTTKLPA